METKPSSLLKKTLLYGSVLGIVLVIYAYVLHITKLEKNTWLGLLQYVFPIVTIFISIQCYRNRVGGGFITYGKALGTGVLTIVWASIIIAIYTYILTKYIDPNILENAKGLAMENMEKSGNSEQAEKMSGLFDFMLSSGFMSVMAFIGNVFFGTIFSLIIAAILKKEKDIFSEPEVIDQEIN